MRMRLAALVGAVAIGCSGGGGREAHSLALVLPDRVVVHAGETLMITLLSIGASGTVNYSVDGLPPFATLQGNIIRAMPVRTDAAGDSTVTVTATDGAQTDMGSFVLSLANAPPVWTSAIAFRTPGPTGWRWMDRRTLEGPDSPLVLTAKARIEANASDADGDALELLVELRAASDPMKGVANLRSGAGQPLVVELPVLEMGVHYALDAWLVDSHGAESTHARRSDVIRQNTPPQHCDMELIEGSLPAPGAPDSASWGSYVPVPSPVVLYGTVTMGAAYCDVDGDEAQVLVELQPADGQLTGTPTYVLDGGYPFAGSSTRIDLPLPDVEIGKHYQVAWWFRDSYGAESRRSVQGDFVRLQ